MLNRLVVILILAAAGAVSAAQISFTAGNPAVAADVNANFTELYNAKWTLTGADLSYTGGNIGIGVASPPVKFNVIGGSTITLVGATGFGLFGGATGNHIAIDSTQIQAKTNATTASGLSLNPLGGNVTFGNGTITTGSGNFGIGTSPAAKFHVDAGTLITLAGVTGYGVFGASAGNHVAVDLNQIQAKLNPTTATNIYINALGGNVGIGAATAGAKLDVAGEIYGTGRAMVAASATAMNAIPAPVNRMAMVRYTAGTHPNGSITFQGGGLIFAQNSGSNGNFTVDRFIDGAFDKTLINVSTAGGVTHIYGDLNLGDRATIGSAVVADIDLSGCYRDIGVGVAGTCTSDARLKMNIEPLRNSLARMTAVRPVQYEWKPDLDTRKFPRGRQIGLIAQDVEAIFPELVKTDSAGFKNVRYGLELQMHTIQAIKELKSEKDTQILTIQRDAQQLQKRATEAEQKHAAGLRQAQADRDKAEARAAKLEKLLAEESNVRKQQELRLAQLEKNLNRVAMRVESQGRVVARK